MNSVKLSLLIGVLVFGLSSCKTAQTSMLVMDSYDEKKNHTTLEDQSREGYIVWQARSEEKSINTIFLFGSKNGFAYNFSSTSQKWTEKQILEFLVTMFKEN